MKYKLLVLGLSLALSSCSLLSSSPSSVVKTLMSDAEKGDVNGMTGLWANKAIEEEGADRIRENAQHFVELLRKAQAAGEKLQIENLHETIQGDRARVFFLYRDSSGRDSVGMGFALLKENGKWKLYRSIERNEDAPFDSSFAEMKKVPRAEPTPDETQTMSEVSPHDSNTPNVPRVSKTKAATQTVTTPAPPTENNKNPAPVTKAATAPISGGVMNSKAVALPQPAYPAMAKAVKASGTVTVQISVDENGRVTSAHAVSGHPLLRGSAEAAARSARFKPTLLSGTPVKVTGVLTYNFVAQ